MEDCWGGFSPEGGERGARVLAHQGQPPLVMTTPYIRVPAALLWIQLPVNVVGKAVLDDPGIGSLLPNVGDLDGVFGSWLQPDPAKVVMAVWTVNQQKEDSLLLSLCLSNK